MNCSFCSKPVVLVPSAAERAKKLGKSASYYTALFPNHTDCLIKHRNELTLELIQNGKSIYKP
jgi:hypothetical protein